MMRSLITITSVATLLHTSCAFTSPRVTSAPLIVASPQSQLIRPQSASVSLLARQSTDDHDDASTIELTQSSKSITPKSPTSSSRLSSKRQRLHTTLQTIYHRTQTLQAANLPDAHQAGFKSNVMLLIGAFLFKWYRARFINKIPVWDRQPQWNMVVTSPEQEKELHAYSCKNCGATIFIARHREWFFQGGNTKCTNCGAEGEDNFEDIREEVIDSIDDDYFDYESPLDFVSAAERRKLVKQAGGDEELAKKIAIENVMKNDKEQIQVEEGKKVKSKKKGKKKKKKKKRTEESVVAEKKSASKKEKKVVQEDDIFDELDMDL